MLDIFGKIDRNKVILFLKHPKLLHRFGEYVLAKHEVVEKFAIEAGDESIEAIFLLLLVDGFVRQKNAQEETISSLMIEYSGPEGKGFFVGKEEYLKEGIISWIAEEFFFPQQDGIAQTKYSTFIELFESVWKERSRFVGCSDKKEVVVGICVSVMMRLAQCKEPWLGTDEYLISETSRHLDDFYDAIDEGGVSLKEFYLFYEHGIIGHRHQVSLSNEVKNRLERIPVVGFFISNFKRVILWFRDIG